MSDLTHEEVLHIIRLVEHIENSGFQSAELQIGDLRLSLNKQGAGAGVHPAPAVAPAPPAAAQPSSSGRQTSAAASAPIPPGAEVIRAPMVGRYYGRSEPGAPPYVTLGHHVTADATVGLIESMKVFTAVQAGISGEIVAICANDADFVEYGQPLLYVVPEAVGR